MKKWTVTVNGVPHEVAVNTFTNRFSVDGEKAGKVMTAGLKGAAAETPVPVDGETLYIYSLMYAYRLAYNGIDVETGMPYVPMKMTPLIWVFFFLYLITLIVGGGALGVIIAFYGIGLTVRIANHPTRTNVNKIVTCAGLFVLLLAADLIAVMILTGLLG